MKLDAQLPTHHNCGVSVSASGSRRDIPRRVNASTALDRVPDFLPMDLHVGRRFDPETDGAALYLHDSDLDVVADADSGMVALIGAACENEHVFTLPGLVDAYSYCIIHAKYDCQPTSAKSYFYASVVLPLQERSRFVMVIRVATPP